MLPTDRPSGEARTSQPDAPAEAFDERFFLIVEQDVHQRSGSAAFTTRDALLGEKAYSGDGPPTADDGSPLEWRLDILTANVAEIRDRIVGLADAHNRQLRELTILILGLAEQIANVSSPLSDKAPRRQEALRERTPRAR